MGVNDANDLTIDRVEGHHVTLTREGIVIERPYTIRHVSGAGTAKIVTVTTHGSMPDIGDAHPAFAQAILEQNDFRFTSTDGVEGMLTYRQPPMPAAGYEIEVGTTLEDVEIHQDVNGTEMVVTYDGAGQAVSVSVGRPRSTMVFRADEASSPAAKSRAFVGKVNASGWDWDEGADARTWRCNSIIGRITTADEYWDVTYTFEYDADTWDALGAWIDPNTGRLPAAYDADVDVNAVKRFQVYAEANFDTMGLPSP